MTSDTFDKKYKELNNKQIEAVDTIYGPVMVVAGPGTGKTTVLTLRIANILLKTDAKPEEILALTFTENGARTMREKLRDLIGDTSFRVNIFTFHGFANFIRSRYPENFTKIGERMPASDADKIEIIEDLISHTTFKELRVSQYGVSISKIGGRISDLKRELITAKDLLKIIKKEGKACPPSASPAGDGRREKHLARIEEFAELYSEYEKELERRKLYDFDDAILELIDALRGNEEMLAEVRESFQFVLADEHQDANGAQNEILRLFKNDKEADPPNIFVVGDDKQSIFRFQGASLEHFYNFKSEFKGAKIIELEDNYRSQRIILDSSHSLISRDGRKHQALTSNVVHKERKIEIVEYNEYETELCETARRIKKLTENYAGRASIAVIARHNKTLFDLAPYLEAEEVNFRIAGERSLFESLEYKKLFTLLTALADPYDGRLLKALYAGYFNVPVERLLQIAGEARKSRQDPANLIFEDPLTEQVTLIKSLISKAKRTEAVEFLKEIRSELYKTSEEGYEVLRTVFEEARKLTVKNRAATLDDLVKHLAFLERHNLAPLSGEKGTNAQVELLSVHRSKGLEYDYVFILDVSSRKFEGKGGRGDLLKIPGIGIDGETEEERRLLYVAITRARKHVTMSYSLIDEKGGGGAPSALLAEIDPEFFDRTVVAESVKRDLLSVPKIKDAKKREAFRAAFLTRGFSVTALNNYLECPWKYFFRNLLLIPDVPEYAASLGNACHNVLKDFHLRAKRGEIVKGKALKDLVAAMVHREPFTHSELPLALEKAEEYITAYADDFQGFKSDEIVYIEEPLSYTHYLKDKERSFDITITGKLDLARDEAGEVSVIDFKTKKRMTRNAIMGKTKNDSGNEYRQLQFYKMLTENAKPDVTVVEGILTFLNPDEGKVRSEVFELAKSDRDDIESVLRDTLIEIHDLEFWDKTCGDKDCEYCSLSKAIL